MRVRLLDRPIAFQIALLTVTESLIFFGAPYAAASIWFSAPLAVADAKFEALWPHGLSFSIAMTVGLLSTGLYSARQRAGFPGIFLRILASAAGSYVVLAVLFFSVPHLFMEGGLLRLTVTIGVLGCTGVRTIASRFLDGPIFKRRVIVYGAGTRAASISRLRRRTDQRGFSIAGYIPGPADDVCVPPMQVLVPGGDNLLRLCREKKIDDIVVAMDDRRKQFPLEELLNCRLNGIAVLDLPSFFERETGKIRLDLLDPSWLIFSRGFNRGPVRRFSGRALAVLASLGLLALTWPVMLVIAIAIKIEDGHGAPIFYRQKRVGLEGREFDVLKFRSMRVDAEQDGRAKWAAKNDPRVTHVGDFARHLRLDELPQIFNVLKGDMNFVGPRPERPEFVRHLSEMVPFYPQRHFVKPGITGWAQLCYPYGSSEKDAAEKLQYDLYYVKNHNLLFDLSILLQTAEVVLWGKGAR
jgi:sugar transferase (PEP-CTERM system associated)